MLYRYMDTQTLNTCRSLTWTPKVCRIIAFYRFWAIILPTFEGLGKGTLQIILYGHMEPEATLTQGLCLELGWRDVKP